MKKSFIIILVLVFSLIVAGCGTVEPEDTSSEFSSTEESALSDSNQTSEDSMDEELKIFTIEELAEFDGNDGNKAYVAVNGLVYDVTDVSVWSDGSHFNNITAGKDLTEIIENDSPHGLKVLENLPIVGKLEN